MLAVILSLYARVLHLQSGIQPLTALLRITFNNFAVKQTGMNSAFSYNIENAITGTYPNYTIAYENVLVGRGDLPNVLGCLWPTALT